MVTYITYGMGVNKCGIKKYTYSDESATLWKWQLENIYLENGQITNRQVKNGQLENGKLENKHLENKEYSTWPSQEGALSIWPSLQ